MSEAARLSGIECSQKMREQLRKRVAELKEQTAKPVRLAVVQTGDNPQGDSYLKNNVKICRELGIDTVFVHLPGNVPQQDVLEEIHRLNADSSVCGILVQLPLPKHLDEATVFGAISVEKDVDGVNPLSAGRLLFGHRAFAPCTPSGVMRLLQEIHYSLDGKHVVILGRSNIVGKPLWVLLLQQNATVTVCHSKTKHLKDITKQADLIVSSVGKAKFVTADMVKEGAVVVDIGINFEGGKLCGDVDYEGVSAVAGYVTPTPGGTGPMTVTMLAQNVVTAFEQQNL